MELTRRDFIRATGTGLGALVIGFHFPFSKTFAAEKPFENAAVNSWLVFAPDNTVAVYLGKAEMGQGIYTGLPMIIAEEAELDWTKVRVEFAPSTAPYIDPKSPFTGGSSSTRTQYTNLRLAGAAAKQMLIAAAARQWGVAPNSCIAKKGFVTHAAKKLSYGELALAASKFPVPSDPKLKSTEDFEIIGKKTKRLDGGLKVSGKAIFGIDTVVPGMLYAAVRTSPVFGGDVSNFDALNKTATSPNITLVKVPGGVAVVAGSYWKAQQIADRLDIQFSDGENQALSSEKISALLKTASDSGVIVSSGGDVENALKTARTKLEAEYEVPFLAHATMEPPACTAHVTEHGCELWVPTQSPFYNKVVTSKVLGIDPEKVIVHSTFLGGGFGRKAEQDFVTQAVLASKAVGKPVKLIWSREEDIQHDFYRPAYYARLEGALDEAGNPTAWLCKSAGDSIMSRWFPDMVKQGIDPTSVEGAKDIGYEIPNHKMTYALRKTGVPVGFWRSVGSSQNAFFVESFLDEMAHAAGKDPYQFRRALLKNKPGLLKVLDTAAIASGWGKPLPHGHHRGIAMAESFGSVVAQVLEVSVSKKGEIKVHKVSCAVDCGKYVNPYMIEAQMQSCVAFGLTAALKGKITLKNGRVLQNNFNDYGMLMLREMPKVDVHIIESDRPMGGIGEPGVPPVAPALANAIFAATGKRVRSLPIQL
jgi:isoquinoline 1-oxidoreductase beta subunit